MRQFRSDLLCSKPPKNYVTELMSMIQSTGLTKNEFSLLSGIPIDTLYSMQRRGRPLGVINTYKACRALSFWFSIDYSLLSSHMGSLRCK